MTPPFSSTLAVHSLMLLAVWALVLLVLWQLHRHADFLPGRKMVATIAAISFLCLSIFGVMAFRYWKDYQIGQRRLVVFAFPFFDDTNPPVLQPESVALADLAVQAIQADTAVSLRIYPLDAIYPPMEPDSLVSLNYLKTTAVRLPLPHFVLGSLTASDGQHRLDWKLYAGRGPQILRQGIVTYGAREWNKAAMTLATELGAVFGIKPIAPAIHRQPRPDYYRFRLAMIQQDWQRAEQIAHHMLRSDSTDVLAWQCAAEIALREARLLPLSVEERRQQLSSLTKQLATLSDGDTTNATLARLAATGYYWCEKFNPGALYLLRAFRHAQCDARIFDLLAKFHFTRYRPLGFFNEAELYTQALRCNPADISAVLDLAAAYVQLKETPKAQALLESYVEIYPENVALLHALGQIYVLRGLALKIFATYERILQRHPDDPDALYNLGIYYFNNEDTLTAMRFFQRAIQAGNHLNSRLYLARIAEKQSRLDDAIRYLRERIRLKTGVDDAYAEEARRHLFDLMRALGKIDSTGRVKETR